MTTLYRVKGTRFINVAGIKHTETVNEMWPNKGPANKRFTELRKDGYDCTFEDCVLQKGTPEKPVNKKDVMSMLYMRDDQAFSSISVTKSEEGTAKGKKEAMKERPASDKPVNAAPMSKVA
jgi:hypothetical protein